MALVQNCLAARVRLIQDGFKLSSLLPASIPPPEHLPVSLSRGGNTAPLANSLPSGSRPTGTLGPRFHPERSKGDALHGGISDSRGASQRARGKLLIACWFGRNVISVE